ncbi:hypothetical protein K466DRAFT_496324 [Polyporus arcularius HHB13444]|uniref:Uncharacterized protein n=1 Tax=Polyporus arcularius HHB13444 TaxID=1314778 RepID=A0A5C3P4J6_9APHY|nr:hypothetical protein K466DRAFT_496324 [Polyporus arcularius HHB13444]
MISVADLFSATLGTVHAFTGIVAAPGFSQWSVFTTPNADWVPEFAIAHGEITTFSDGRWGHHEYSRWPQAFDRHDFHIPCIPRSPPPNAPFSKILWTTFKPSDWKVNNCGVLGVGLLHPDTQDMLIDAVQEVISRLHELGEDGPWRSQGHFLIVCINHTLDCLRLLPAARGVIITLAAHVQRLSLELWGLIKWLQDIRPLVAEGRNVAARPWDIVGAHTSDAHTAERLHMAGIPVWFQQPLTTLLAVHDVVQPTALPADFSREPANPQLFLAKRDMSGALNVPGEWNRAMSALVRRQLMQSRLPALLTDDDDTEPSVKRLREGAVFVGEVSSSIGPAAPVFFVQEHGVSRALWHHLPAQPAGPSPQLKSPVPSQLSRRARARIKKREAARVESISLPPPPIPARQYYSSRLVAPSPVWTLALTGQGHLQQPRSSVTYYFAPPWLLDHLEGYPADKKTTRYLHNWLSIRTFCRVRLFDRTIDGRPLTISEWRESLWGDYKITESVESAEARVPRERVRYSVRESIRRLFGNSNALPSYDGDSRPLFGKTPITLQMVQSDVETQKHIVWEVYETNWRCELLALDTLVVGTAEWPQVQRLEREHLISQVWGSGTSGLDIVPSEAQAKTNLCWRDPQEPGWEDSRRHLAAFVTILARWRDAPQGLTEAALAVPTCKVDEYSRIQSTVVNFYVRTFVDRYGRLPVPPVSVQYV